MECEMGVEQTGFRRGRGTACRMITLIQLVENKLEGQETIGGLHEVRFSGSGRGVENEGEG